MRILEIKTTSLKVEQSALTGESQPASKYVEVIRKPEAVITEKFNILYSATLISTGTAIGVVFATGKHESFYGFHLIPWERYVN